MKIICDKPCPKGMVHEGENICCCQCPDSDDCEMKCDHHYTTCNHVLSADIE